MKTTKYMLAAILTGWLAVLPLNGQPFDSGSNGSYGPMNVTNDTTLDLPPDGIFHCTTVNVAQNKTLRFRRNARNTPVYLLATSNVTLLGVIDVSGGGQSDTAGGLGGPGGFDGGARGTVSLPPGAGYGPGAGKGSTPTTGGAGHGAFGSSPFAASTNNGLPYGNNLSIPMVGGSGAGGNQNRGGGGGAGVILIAANIKIEMYSSGGIRAEGGFGGASGDSWGSGGAIRLVTPQVIAGGASETLKVTSNLGGHGRIRIDTLDRSSFPATLLPAAAASFGKFMVVFSTPVPTLRIVEVAGRLIPEDTATPVSILLPTGSPTNQTIKVQARDFIGLVPINVVLTPQNGAPSEYPAQIDMSTGNPAQVTVNVAVPVNVETVVNAWTR